MSNIESSDINDSDILSKTVQKRGQENQVQFFYTLPSGKTINSEWVSSENRKQGLMAWIDAVRQNILADLKRTQREKIEAAIAARPVVAVPEGTQVADLAPGKIVLVDNGGSMPQPLARSTVSDDPLEHANAQVVLLLAEVKHWEAELGRARVNYDGAQRKLKKWQNIIAAFAASGDDSGE